LLLQFLIGVDAWIGLVVPTEDGLWNDASESILNLFDVLSVRSGKVTIHQIEYIPYNGIQKVRSPLNLERKNISCIYYLIPILTASSSLSKTATASINILSYPDISSLSDSDIQNTEIG
jgi:hypothetical protein